MAEAQRMRLTATVARCAVCLKVAVVIGDARVMLCHKCWPGTLAWTQVASAERWLVARAFVAATAAIHKEARERAQPALWAPGRGQLRG